MKFCNSYRKTKNPPPERGFAQIESVALLGKYKTMIASPRCSCQGVFRKKTKDLALEDLQGLAPRSRYLPSNARRFFRPRSKSAPGTHRAVVQCKGIVAVAFFRCKDFLIFVYNNLQQS